MIQNLIFYDFHLNKSTLLVFCKHCHAFVRSFFNMLGQLNKNEFFFFFFFLGGFKKELEFKEKGNLNRVLVLKLLVKLILWIILFI